MAWSRGGHNIRDEDDVRLDPPKLRWPSRCTSLSLVLNHSRCQSDIQDHTIRDNLESHFNSSPYRDYD